MGSEGMDCDVYVEIKQKDTSVKHSHRFATFHQYSGHIFQKQEVFLERMSTRGFDDCGVK